LTRLGLLAQELGLHRVLLVTDRGIVAAGHAERATEFLRAAGVPVVSYAEVRENPTTVDVARCLEVARAEKVDGFVGLGGGSSMDTAKGANFLLTNGGEIRDYWGVGKARHPLLPLIAIPTTSGTGSECQSAALIADPVSHQKMACLDPKAAARIALLDPELTLSQPARVTAITGVDALAHALETAVTNRRNPLSFMYSQAAFSYLMPAFPRVLSHPNDIESRGRMLLGSSLAGVAIENSMLGAAHSAANPLTAHFQIVHGIAVGLMLPEVMRFNSGDPSAHGVYLHLAQLLNPVASHSGEAASVERLIRAVEALLNLAGVPRSLLDAGVRHELLPTLAAEAETQWTARFNPRPIHAVDFLRLYEAACEPRRDAGDLG
jgi:alcohol dehydrogenase